ncbi:MAG: 1,4-dihydroxy-2-naphthoate polyprenyltransferase [Puniceicoccales bacterium]|jgi:1,4-dihydroxy-2-naphthoate octaprenyltransferase|nr:1,4-dihydroxy-2-naphthoate polyprenyltransferase [Puniceicoccales bacterium]
MFARFPERAWWRAWWLACRPKTLAAAFAPVALGSACATAQTGEFHTVPAALALLFALLTQITCNFANDHGDFARGADTAARVGPTRAVASGAVSPSAMRCAVGLCATAAFGAGMFLVAWGGWWLVPVGAVCLLACLAYTGGPFPLAYNGLGDVFVVLFFGFTAVLFTAYTQCGLFPSAAWAAGLVCGLLAANILVVNNARDMATDARAGKRTTVVLFGRGFARIEYVANLCVALAAPVVLCSFGGFGAWVLLPLATLPLAVALGRAFWRVREPVAHNPLLGKTAAFLLAHSLLFAAGLVLGAGTG